MVLGELGGVVRKAALEEERVPASGPALVERGLGLEHEVLVVVRTDLTSDQDVLDEGDDGVGRMGVDEDVSGRVDRCHLLEQGDARGDAREGRREGRRTRRSRREYG